MKKIYGTYAIVSILFLLILAAIPPLTDHSYEWKKYQKKFYALKADFVREETKRKEIKNTPLEIKQIIVDELRVDRCVTCHLGIEDKDFMDAVQPFRTHSNYSLHPFEKFGCTLCHAGQGRATTKDAAHGKVKYWEAPLIPLNYIQSSCGKCHVSNEIPGAPDLSKGRKVFKEKGCYACHKIAGKGGNLGPDLTHEGRYGHRNPEWLFKHFKDPQALVPESTMPNFNFSDEEARALTMYMLSLTDEKIGGFFISKKIIPDISVGKSLFEEKGCRGCHKLEGKGGDVGPDLTHVAMRRDADWIFRHFKEPRAVTPGTVMPRFGFSDDEAKSLTMFLLSRGKEDVVGYIKAPRKSRKRSKRPAVKEGFLKRKGEKLYKSKGCSNCHKLGEEGGGLGPELTQVGKRRDREWHFKHFKDPQSVVPDSIMPKLQLSEEEIRALTEYMLSLK